MGKKEKLLAMISVEQQWHQEGLSYRAYEMSRTQDLENSLCVAFRKEVIVQKWWKGTRCLQGTESRWREGKAWVLQGSWQCPWRLGLISNPHLLTAMPGPSQDPGLGPTPQKCLVPVSGAALVPAAALLLAGVVRHGLAPGPALAGLMETSIPLGAASPPSTLTGFLRADARAVVMLTTICTGD